MPAVEVSHLTKCFGAMTAVDDVSFSIERGEILVIVGASGCGKTTTLRCLAGLERPTAGNIAIDGVCVASDDVFVVPERRGIGMVFQSYALWPHMTVFDNIAYGLRLMKRPKAEIGAAVRRVVELVGLSGMEERYPSTLSGGQQQRVALARSAVAEPKLLLLDEPLSNLDAKLREQMRNELRQLVRKLEMTTVHITHDQAEAMAIADRIIYMAGGRIAQEGSPRDLYRYPASRAVAEFVGNATFLDGRGVRSDGDNLLLVEIGEAMALWARPLTNGRQTGAVTVAVRPEQVTVSNQPLAGKNSFTGTIRDQLFLGDHTEYVVEVGGVALKARSIEDFETGSPVNVSIDPRTVISFPASEPAAPKSEPPT